MRAQWTCCRPTLPAALGLPGFSRLVLSATRTTWRCRRTPHPPSMCIPAVRSAACDISSTSTITSVSSACSSTGSRSHPTACCGPMCRVPGSGSNSSGLMRVGMPPERLALSPTVARSLESTLRARMSGQVDFSAGARALYAADASNYRQTPVGIVLPRSVDDVIESVRTCREYGVPILPRGTGTSLAGQCCNVAVVMDMSRHLHAILAIDPARKVARVQPGVVLDQLQHALEPHGLIYGPDPAT